MNHNMNGTVIIILHYMTNHKHDKRETGHAETTHVYMMYWKNTLKSLA